MITLKNVSLRLAGNLCLQDINACISHTGITLVVGANGAGKTLLLQLLAGLQPAHTGHYQRQPSLTYPDVSYLPSVPVLLDRSVSYNIAFPLQALSPRQNAAQITQRITEALTWAGIESLIHKQALTLSSGQQQLVALARAWALSPTLLLLDEPCANLDPHRQQHIDRLLKKLSSECKIILSSHTITQAKRIADDILFLDKGRIITHTDSDVFFTQEASRTLPTCIQQWLDYA